MTSTPSPWLLQAEGIHKRFGDNEVLRGVSVNARQGDVISMIGSSGSGKSTFLRCLNLLELPNAGRITVAGEELALVPDKSGALKARDVAQLQRLRSRVAMVFQHFNLWAHMTALENVIEAPIQVLGLSRSEAVARAERYLQRVGVLHRCNAYPAHLSGGEQQRVAIARALVCKPKILLADEPTGNLDTENSIAVLKIMSGLNKKYGQTILMITHNPEAADFADRKVRMKDGRVLEPAGEILEN